MNRKVLCLVTCAFFAVGAVGFSMRPSVVAQESGTAAKTEKGAGTKKVARSGDRLPAFYAKIGVTEEQRKSIYAIQSKYDDQITVIQKQLADLRAKEKSEVEAVLTPEQKKTLKSVSEESQKKADEKKKSGEKEKAEKGIEKTEKGEK